MALMTIAQAAERLGLEKEHGPHASQYLRRLLLKREEATGATILTRVGKNPERPRYRVSMNAIRRHVPELVDHADEITRALREMVNHQRREMMELREQLAEQTAMLDTLTEAVRRLQLLVGGRRAA